MLRLYLDLVQENTDAAFALPGMQLAPVAYNQHARAETAGTSTHHTAANIGPIATRKLASCTRADLCPD